MQSFGMLQGVSREKGLPGYPKLYLGRQQDIDKMKCLPSEHSIRNNDFFPLLRQII